MGINTQYYYNNNLTVQSDTKVLVDQQPKIQDNGGMTNKGAIMTDFEKNCYGMSQDAIREQYIDGITARCSGLEMVVMGILSDVQELVAMGGRPETTRKQLNIAKFILSEMMDAKERV